MTAKSPPAYMDDPRELLAKLANDKNVAIKRRQLPWDKDVEIVDFYLDHRGEGEDRLYSTSKCK